MGNTRTTEVAIHTAPPTGDAPGSVNAVDRVLSEVYDSGTVVAADGTRFDVLPVGMRREQGEALAQLVKDSGAVRTVETGFAMGLSGLFMVRATKANAEAAGRPDEVFHVAMDPFEEERWHSAGRNLFDLAGVGERLECHERGSEYVLPHLAESGAQFDFGFVDGNHKFDAAFIDIFYMLRVVRPGGIIAVDDTWMPSVRAAVDFFIKNFGLRAKTRLGDDPEQWSKKNWRIGGRARNRFRAKRTYRMVALIVPDEPDDRDWEHFVPFAGPRITRRIE